jgi:ClpP class serine protease
MERGFLTRLLSDRRELLAISRTLGTAEAMRAAREDLISSAAIYVTPQTPEQTAASYIVDADGVAHIPIKGELTPQAKTDACGAYTAQALTEYGFISAASAAADSDPKVKSIVYDVDSPGGYVDGVDMAAQAMASVKKPTESRVWGFAASAAYWLASQTDRIVAMTPAAQFGSIGVALEEFDKDEALAREGIAHRVYSSTDAPDKRPDTKTPEGRAKIVAYLDSVHSVFAARVAEGRKVTAEKVAKDFGRGGLLIAADARKAGMIDEIVGTSISRHSAGVASSAAAQAAIPNEEVRMDLNTLKAEHPDVYAQAVKVGVDQERSRADGLRKWLVASPGNTALATIVNEALAAGKAESDVLPSLITAAQSKPVADTPPPVPTATAKNGANAEGEADDDGSKGEAQIRALISGKTTKEAAHA